MKLFNKKVVDKDEDKVYSDDGIKILGSGCKKCMDLEVATKQAVEELGLSIDIEHITDMVKIASYGVMSTPALVINKQVKSTGKLLSVSEIKDIINKG